MTKKKAMPRPYHHGDLKRALVEASIELIREQGVEALTVAEVGRRVGGVFGRSLQALPDRRALLQAVSMEGNRRLGAALVEAVGDCKDPVEAFRLSGVAYICWGAENPALHRLASDPQLLDYDSRPEDLPDVQAPQALEGTMDTFWPELAALVRSGGALPATHPLVEQLRGRALAQGIVSYFASGVFGALGITIGDAERIARAVTGEDVPAVRRKKSPSGG